MTLIASNDGAATAQTNILGALTALITPGHTTEIRILGVGGDPRRTASGYFNDMPAAARAAMRYEGRATGIYVTPNPVNPALLGRAANRIIDGLKPTTSDPDIIGRRFLLIDADPQRPAGISSSKEEHEDAHQRIGTIRAHLRDEGWPEGIYADSGNGAHLVYRVDLPADDDGLTQRVLAALAEMFNNDEVKIDTTVYNPARIWKLYGTMACKGDSTPDRPHRMSRIIDRPEIIGVVSREMLEAVAGSAVAVVRTNAVDIHRATNTGAGLFDVEAYLTKYGVPFTGPEGYQGGQKWKLDACVWNGHTDDAAIVTQMPGGIIGANCSHNSCEGMGWMHLREHFEPGYRAAKEAKERDYQERTANPSATAAPQPVGAWPAPLGDEAYHGVIGEIVRTIEPHTESDPVAILVQLLVAAGNCIGRTPYFKAEADHHRTNLFAVLVGDSSKARKGTSWGHVRRVIERIDAHWVDDRIMDGLSSGEGLIQEVRDPISVTKTNKDGEAHDEIVDAGASDKRLLVQAPEFAAVLQVQSRDGNTLSGVMRCAWDGRNLSVMTRKNPLKATGAHISIIGHVTRDELLRLFQETDAANGYGNRFLWLAVRRSKELPFGGQLSDEELNPLVDRLAEAIYTARSSGELRRDAEANAIWVAVYSRLSEGKPGLLGAMIARAEAQVMRLACLYALLDQSAEIRKEHMQAALTLWDYCERSARWIFGDRMGDPVADEILRMLRISPEGMTRTEINDSLGRNRNAAAITNGLRQLQEYGLVRCERQETGGRPAERWHATARTT